jgi:RNA polymerase sigma-70 factor (ECF subfamily)
MMRGRRRIVRRRIVRGKEPRVGTVPGTVVDDELERARRFRDAALPYFDEVYTLARYLLRNVADAEDAVQESYLRAFQYFDGFRGPAIKPWLMAILRNVCHAECARRGPLSAAEPNSNVPDDADSDLHEGDDAVPLWQEPQVSPEIEALRRTDQNTMQRLLAAMPNLFQEVLILRDVNDLPYRDIAQVVGTPLGTVMSRLARARAMLRDAWLAAEKEKKL